ncbi:hypothetical protein LOAG_05981 [Loa loa]|nr:hypothetical protein LOAG_05981 [Loa loa]EFO22508.1 hypothetical protein LOAG_05981 [Loa loa]
MHTCCNLTINEDVQIRAHTGNDCFLYDLPDGSNGTTAEELEKEDKEGYTLLKDMNKVPEQFADFSGYRLRLYLLRKKEQSQFVVKGVERNEVGYRVTICSIQCQNDTEKVEKVAHDEGNVDLGRKEPVISDNTLNQIKFALRNLTDDGQWLIAHWAEWSYKKWSEWSTERKIEFNDLDGTKERGHRYRIHQTSRSNEIKTVTGTGQQKSESIKTSIHGRRKEHHQVHKKKDSSDCDDSEYYNDEEIGKSVVSQDKEKLKEHFGKFGGSGSKKELKREKQNFAEGEKVELIATGEIGNQTKGTFNETEAGNMVNFEIQTNHTITSSHIPTTKKDRGRSAHDTVGVTTTAKNKKEDHSNAKKGGHVDDLRGQKRKKSEVEKDTARKPKSLKEKSTEKMVSKKLRVNATTSNENGTSKGLEKELTLKEKTSDKQGEKKNDELKNKLKSGSKQSPKSVVSPARKGELGHDPVVPVVGAGRQADVMPPPNCFSADTKVYTHNGEKTMKEVLVGDFVLVPVSKSQLRYERVEMFYHREPETRAKFVVLETESGRKLSLTELHLLPLGDCKKMRESMTDTADIVDQWLRKSKFAHKARIGDCVFTVTSNHELQVDRIIKIGRQYLKGIYSPMTVEGSIVADGVLASCFSQVENHFTQKLVYDFFVFLHRIFSPFMQSLDEPIQHLPTFIDSIHHLGRFALPFVKY